MSADARITSGALEKKCAPHPLSNAAAPWLIGLVALVAIAGLLELSRGEIAREATP